MHKILHKMSVDLHKQQERQIDSKKPNVSVDIEHENRKAKVLTLYTKGIVEDYCITREHIFFKWSNPIKGPFMLL
jgi:hypothetical protein